MEAVAKVSSAYSLDCLTQATAKTLVFMDRGRYIDSAVLQEAFEFKKPIRPASRGCLHSHGLEEGKDIFTQRQNSAPARMVCALAFTGEFLVGKN